MYHMSLTRTMCQFPLEDRIWLWYTFVRQCRRSVTVKHNGGDGTSRKRSFLRPTTVGPLKMVES